MLGRWFASAALALCFAFLCVSRSSLLAAEVSTDAERRFREFRDSEDVKTRLLAERWYGVVRLQEWGDASGKFKTTAKYVEHDPALAWVKLRVVQGTGDKRVVKDVTIPLEKLNKTCQSRVRQISVLAEKMAAAAVEEKERDADQAEGANGADRGASEMASGREPASDREMMEKPRGRRGENSAELAGMEVGEALTEGEPAARGPAAESAPQQPIVVTNNGPPLPALLPPLPSGRTKLSAVVPVRDEPAAESTVPADDPEAEAPPAERR